MTLRIGITGSNGQLGLCLMDLCQQDHDIHIVPFTRDHIDLNTNLSVDAVRTMIQREQCDVFINTAAYTSVDGAENDIASAYIINEKSPRVLATACAQLNIPFIHISTDYVFDGTKNTPYVETDPVRPLSVYGKSKEAGEVAVRAAHSQSIIIRSAWLFSAYRKNFLKTMIELGQKKTELSIVSDQIGSPTDARDLAQAILSATRAATSATRDPSIFDTYHYAGTPETSWHGFATEIFVRAQKHHLKTPAHLIAIPTSGYPLPAKRPAYSALSSTRFTQTFGTPASDWGKGIDDTLKILIQRGEI